MSIEKRKTTILPKFTPKRETLKVKKFVVPSSCYLNESNMLNSSVKRKEFSQMFISEFSNAFKSYKNGMVSL